MKLDKDIIIIGILILFFWWRSRRNNAGKTNQVNQNPVLVDDSLSSNTNWHDGMVEVNTILGNRYWYDSSTNLTLPDGRPTMIGTLYSDSQRIVYNRNWYLMQSLTAPTQDIIEQDNAFYPDGSALDYFILDGEGFLTDFSANIIRGCMDINNAWYNPNANVSVPQHDCFGG